MTNLTHGPSESTKTSVGSPFRLRHLLETNKWVQALEIAIIFSPVAVLLTALHLSRLQNPFLLFGAIWMGYIVMVLLIGASLKIRAASWTTLGLRFKIPRYQDVGRAFGQSLLVFVFALAAFVFGSIVMANLVGIPESADMAQYDYLRGNVLLLVLSLLGVYVASSFGEEVVYRGFLVTRLEGLFGGATRRGLVGAVLVSAVIFGLAHYQWGAMGVGQTTCMGAALALSFVWTKRNLWPLVLAHAYMDSILLIQLFWVPASSS